MGPDMRKAAEMKMNSSAFSEDRNRIPKAGLSAENHGAEQGIPAPDGNCLIEKMLERTNLVEAYKRVVSNKGSAGVDGISVTELKDFIKTHWSGIKEQILKGNYCPQSVLGVEIDKPNGGKRLLGIPTVMDRVIQQALHQILSPIFEKGFSESSYGFRPGRSAHQAILQSRQYMLEGKRWVVDMDLAKFFDEVNHDLLISRVKRKVKDKRVLKLIGSYLRAGIVIDGIMRPREKGTPQGGNLSPLLANIMLDDLDKELEKRGHRFCRYADDCNIYVKSQKAGERVMRSIQSFIEKRLKLKVNQEKSAVARPSQRKFLGYSFTSNRKPKIRVAEESKKKFREKIRNCFRSGRGRNLGSFIQRDLNPKIAGWINYFILAEVKEFANELDGWIRRKLRCLLWKQWKRPWTRKENLIKAGLPEERAVMSAFNQRGSWWNAGARHMNLGYPKKYFDKMGLVSITDRLCFHHNY